MKKTISMLLMITTVIAFSQKKNGTVYLEHPAIDVVATFTDAFVRGDTTKIASLLTDDFRSFNGLFTSPDFKGWDKSEFINHCIWWFNELDYFSISDFPGAYPDAIEYQKDNDDDVVWVQTWELLNGIHKTTGVKYSSPIHRLFVVTNDNKIKTVINYFNESIFDDTRKSNANRSNGTIYNHHENINTVRKAVYAFENSDLDKAISYYAEDAQFFNINDDYDKPDTKENVKALRQKFLDDFQIKSIEMLGYPDYLEYEIDNHRSVLSWWNFHLIRKADKKEIVLRMHMNNDFDEDGKITREVIYFNRSLLEE